MPKHHITSQRTVYEANIHWIHGKASHTSSNHQQAQKSEKIIEITKPSLQKIRCDPTQWTNNPELATQIASLRTPSGKFEEGH